MNKRAIFIFVLIIVFVIFFYLGFTWKRNNKQEEIIKNDMIFDENINEATDNKAIETVSQEEKTTPNTVLVLKKYYIDCDHTISNRATIPEEMVNLTKEELAEKYKNWEIEEFSQDEVILSRELESFCGEHYYLMEEDGHINIYTVDEAGNKTLKEENRMSCEYLPETDRITLRNGIMVYTKEELNKILEDFES